MRAEGFIIAVCSSRELVGILSAVLCNDLIVFCFILFYPHYFFLHLSSVCVPRPFAPLSPESYQTATRVEGRQVGRLCTVMVGKYDKITRSNVVILFYYNVKRRHHSHS